MSGSGTGQDQYALHTLFLTLLKGEDSAFAQKGSSLRTNRRHQASRIHLKRLLYPLSSRKTRQKGPGEVVKEGEDKQRGRGGMDEWK